MERQTIARPYARAAFEYAKAHQNFDAWSQFLLAASTVVSAKKVIRYLADPKLSAAERVKTILTLCDKYQIDKADNFLMLLATYNKLALLPEITALYEHYRAQQEKTQHVDVFSAEPLAADAQQRLITALEKRLQRKVSLHWQQDRSLIGGLLIRAGDLVIDRTVKDQLARLEQVLVSA